MQWLKKNRSYLLIIIFIIAVLGICWSNKCCLIEYEDAIHAISEIVAIISVVGIVLVLWSSIETNKETRDETKAANMINSLELYMKIYEYKADALVAKEEHKIQKAEHFWRALLDLQFAEFRLCEQKFIDKGVFLIWTFARWLNYQDDAQTEHEVNGVTLQKVWNDLNNINYFQHKDNFLYFMKEVFALPKNNTSNWDEITKEIKEKIMVIINNYIP